ncbi:hypothetical protein DFH07DRAFT_948360 [Mycena maculata]|uniref:Uncharacterized protein n=1 Tax=Mycena maculata TaxID=230809 RepID=A0AAD7KGU7_9AGAR|nr:hypothetical protein DFH07DRAFT_948360 [Mycena maculata]
MKLGLAIFLAATLLQVATVTGTQVAKAEFKTLPERLVSQWATERLAALLEVQLAAQAVAPAQHDDIEHLESQWAAQQAASELLDTDSIPRGQSGYISVHLGGSYGPIAGFLATNKIVETWTEATKYHIEEPDLPVTQIDVADLGLRMCVAVGPFGENIGPSMPAFHHARHAPSVQVEAGPHWSKELHAFIMTSVFSLDPESKEITVRWINPEGDSPRTVIAMAHERVFYTGDMAAFERQAGIAEVVAFRWVEMRAD